MTDILEDIPAKLEGYARELAAAIQTEAHDVADAVKAEIDRLKAYIPHETAVPAPAPEVAVAGAVETAVVEPAPETTKA